MLSHYYFRFLYHTDAFESGEIASVIDDDSVYVGRLSEFIDEGAKASRPSVIFMDYENFIGMLSLVREWDAKKHLLKIVVFAGDGNDTTVEEFSLSIVWEVVHKNAHELVMKKAFESAILYLDLDNVQKHYQKELENVGKHLSDLNSIGIALSAQMDLDSLLYLIVSKSKEITNADAGSLWMVEEHENSKYIRFKLSRNDSLSDDTDEFSLPVNKKSIVGYVALTGKTLIIDDSSRIPPQSEYQHNHSFDEKRNYKTISIMTSPMVNHEGEILGVIQLINRKKNQGSLLKTVEDFQNEVIPFNRTSKTLIQSLASQASVAIENAMLYKNLENVFESFVRASVGAIDDRNPATSGHSLRVTEYSLALAKAISDCDEGVYADVVFSDDEMRELRYASLLHDFGKIAVREKVLTKEKKLYYGEEQTVLERFESAFLSVEALYAKKICGAADDGEKIKALVEGKESEIEKLKRYRQVVVDSNEPRPLEEEASSVIDEIASYRYVDISGREKPLIMPAEALALKIKKGSLSSEERAEMNSHVLYTNKFLSQLPWPKALANVADIASKHHERLDGKGYPYAVSGDDIPLQARIMMVADIFDALTAQDRPYKKPIAPAQTLKIIEEEFVSKGAADADVFKIFKDKGVYHLYYTLKERSRAMESSV